MNARVFPEVWAEIQPKIEGLPLVAHNSPFDEGCLKSVFQMYVSEECEITLRCDNSLMKYIIERFGEDVQTTAYDMTSFRTIVDVELSPTFYSWVFTFGGKVQILTPEHAKEEYYEMLKKALETEKG